jgi:hypothetical protein
MDLVLRYWDKGLFLPGILFSYWDKELFLPGILCLATSLISYNMYKTLQLVLLPKKGNMILSRQFLSRYTGCPFITVTNTDELQCFVHIVAY